MSRKDGISDKIPFFSQWLDRRQRCRGSTSVAGRPFSGGVVDSAEDNPSITRASRVSSLSNSAGSACNTGRRRSAANAVVSLDNSVKAEARGSEKGLLPAVQERQTVVEHHVCGGQRPPKYPALFPVQRLRLPSQVYRASPLSPVTRVDVAVVLRDLRTEPYRRNEISSLIFADELY